MEGHLLTVNRVNLSDVWSHTKEEILRALKVVRQQTKE
jgi:hypothetical protein